MNQPLRIAVIGAGHYAGQYHIPHLAANPLVELVALCGKDPADLAAQADRFGVPTTYDDYQDLLEKTPLDAVVVSSPHSLHFEHCLASLQRGLHVLVDKPPVLRAAEWLALTTLAAQKERILMPALNRHLDPANLHARHVIQSGALGEVYYARSLQVGYPLDRSYADVSLAGGGPLVGRGTHMAALIPWLTGWRPREVTGLVTPSDRRVDTGGVVSVRAANGALFQIASVRTGSRNVDEVEVIGTRGVCRVTRPVGGKGWVVAYQGANDELIPPNNREPGRTTTDHFVDVVLNREKNRIPPVDGLRAVAIIEAAYESVQTGRTVVLDLPGSEKE